MLRRLSTLFLILIPGLLFSQDSLARQESRLVRLIDAKSAELIPINGKDFRRVTGPAQFLHNGALILCDTALWDVTANTIDAIGNVRIIQNQTTLFGDRIKYVADRSVAEVRGKLVELIDKEGNRLRTHYLDYFTKDSLAMFYNGGCMMSKDSNTIESMNGFYYGKQEKFLFQMKVEMEGDSVIFSADSLAYLTKLNRAVFLSKTNAWQGDGFLQANGGWYDRKNELFHFTKNAYIKTKENEIWADTINYFRKTAEAELFNNIQLLDSAQSAILFADYAKFKQKPFNVLLTDKPSVASYTVENGVADTLFFTADTIRYKTLLRNEVDSAIILQSEKRYAQSKNDPLAEIFKMQAALQPKASKKMDIANEKLPAVKNTSPGPKGKSPTEKDVLTVVKDSLSLAKMRDTISVKKDTLAAAADTAISKAADTTSIRFLYANKKVKFYRNNMQGICDSLLFNSIDSLIRLFKDPVIWTDNNQLSSDSVQVVISDGKIKKAELTSSAFVVMQEDSTHFHQIKSADVVAYFESGDLRRFDAFGGVSVLLFIAEDSILTTMNEKECKYMSARFREKKLIRSSYYENTQSNLYPLYSLEKEKQRLKGFRWLEPVRPKSRFDVSTRSVKSSQASVMSKIEKPVFVQTSIYFAKKKKSEKKAGQPNDMPHDPKPNSSK